MSNFAGGHLARQGTADADRAIAEQATGYPGYDSIIGVDGNMVGYAFAFRS